MKTYVGKYESARKLGEKIKANGYNHVVERIDGNVTGKIVLTRTTNFEEGREHWTEVDKIILTTSFNGETDNKVEVFEQSEHVNEIINKRTIKHIIKEVDPDGCEFSFYFEDDGIKSNIDWRETEKKFSTYTEWEYKRDDNGICIRNNKLDSNGNPITKQYELNPYGYNLFVICNDRYGRTSGFNNEEYNILVKEFDKCAEEVLDIDCACSNYSSYGAMLVDYGLINNKYNGKAIKSLVELFKDDCESSAENIARMLSIVRKEEWDIISVSGYSQGDYAYVLYCKDHFKDEKSARSYGEIWLGCGKEFYVIDLDEDGEETHSCGGYIISDCQAYRDEDYKKIICEWACIKEEETELQMIDGSSIEYSYRIA